MVVISNPDATFKERSICFVHKIFMISSLTTNHPPTRANSSAQVAHLRAVNSSDYAHERPIHLVTPEGQLHVHTASFRGSFSGVLSEALRAAGLGRRVLVAQFLKGGVDQGPQKGVRLCDHLEWLRPEITCCISEQDSPKESIIHKAAVSSIWRACKQRLLAGDLDQLVLDEIGLAIHLGYLDENELISTINKRPGSMDVILTGPSIPSQIMEMADQITKLRCGY